MAQLVLILEPDVICFQDRPVVTEADDILHCSRTNQDMSETRIEAFHTTFTTFASQVSPILPRKSPPPMRSSNPEEVVVEDFSPILPIIRTTPEAGLSDSQVSPILVCNKLLKPSISKEAIREKFNDVKNSLCKDQSKDLDDSQAKSENEKVEPCKGQSKYLDDSQAKAENENQHSQESCSQVHSIDVNLPRDTRGKVATQHLSRNLVRAMIAVNMLLLCGSPVYCKDMGKLLKCGIPQKGRDAFDAAGKFVLSKKLLSLGIEESQIYIDSAQAAGPCGTADGFIPGSRKYIEIKGAGAKSRGSRVQGPDARPQFQASGIRDGSWGLLALVGRERNPKDWTSMAEYDACGFWLGLVEREVFNAAHLAAGLGKDGGRWEEQVVVSPFTEGQRVRHGSWLSPHVRWIKFQDLTLEWCKEHLLGL
uniref:Uncharacterized protein n=1 Tax=Cryptomonas curvata TaxID=233186 RepID=A0A7S0M4W2_9CRYP|mmetsp:Transcript_21080/g.44272  ORF Transcript_21080/g.44272 Transcript_21080/m.44272 type:complete len:422 (+) Transcript_21080:178-1443(+)